MEGDAPFKFGRKSLGCLLLVVFGVVYYVFITPLRQREAQLRASIAVARGQITESSDKVGAIRELQRKAGKVRDELQSLDRDLPAEPPIVWIPRTVQAHFDRFGFANSNTILKSATDEPGLPGYQRMRWSVSVPTQDVKKQAASLLAAVAALDQSQPVLHVVDMEIPRDADETGKWSAKVHFTMVARK
jgi:hypothetical protein